MSTWVGAIIETGNRPDFWQVAGQQGVRPMQSAVPAHALIDCDSGGDFEGVFALAETLSRLLGTTSLGFIIQTGAHLHFTRAYQSGQRIRRLEFRRDAGGWLAVDGTPQPWEQAYFFGSATGDPGDILRAEAGEAERARYRQAREAGQIGEAIDLIHPSSTEPMYRVCAALGIPAGEASGRWSLPKRSLFARLFSRHRV